MSSNRILYNKNFYIIEAIRLSPKFQVLKENIGKEVRSKGVDFPIADFDNPKRYGYWSQRLEEKNISIKSMVDKVAEAFDLDKSNNQLMVGIKHLLFSPEIKSSTNTILYTSEFDDQGNIYLTLKIFPWTTKHDIDHINFAKVISNIRENGIKKAKTKNKEWKSFVMDLEIYQLFNKVKRDIEKGIYKQKSSEGQTSKSPYFQIVYYEEFEEIEKRYDKVDKIQDQLGPIISKCKRYFDGINF